MRNTEEPQNRNTTGSDPYEKLFGFLKKVVELLGTKPNNYLSKSIIKAMVGFAQKRSEACAGAGARDAICVNRSVEYVLDPGKGMTAGLDKNYRDKLETSLNLYLTDGSAEDKKYPLGVRIGALGIQLGTALALYKVFSQYLQ